MNTLSELNGDWDKTKTELKQKFCLLTESDLLFADGKQDELLARLQTKLGRTKEAVHTIISEIQRGKTQH